MRERQCQHCMTPEQRTWLLCSVIPANKLSLQQVNELIGIKLLTSSFMEIFGSLSQIPGGANGRFHPLRTPMLRY